MLQGAKPTSIARSGETRRSAPWEPVFDAVAAASPRTSQRSHPLSDDPGALDRVIFDLAYQDTVRATSGPLMSASVA